VVLGVINLTTEMRLRKMVLEAFDFLFPRGNNLMYWLYYSQIVMIPIYMLCITILLGYLDAGQTIQTDTFVAHMDFSTSYRVLPGIWEVISGMMAYAYVLYQFLAIHTLFSSGFDLYRYFENKFNGKEVDEL